MKKITLLLMAVAFTLQTSFGQQVVFEENFDAAAIPAGWVNLNVDGLSPDEYFATNSLFLPTEWTMVNFTGPGAGAYSLGEFDIPSVPAFTDDWMISPQITLLSNPSVRFDQNALAPGMSFEVLVATTLAGSIPVPADFTMVQAFTPVGDQAWYTENIDLAVYAGQAVYVAIRHTSNDLLTDNQVKILGLKNFKVLQINSQDLRVDAITITDAFQSETDYLASNRSFGTFACGGPAATVVTMSFTNIGLGVMTSFDGYFVIDSLASGNWTAMETVTLGAPLAPGASETYTFTTTADLSGGDPYYSVWAWGNLVGDVSNADDTTALDFLFTPANLNIVTDGDFYDDFEQVDFNAGQLNIPAHAWHWTMIDNNNDGITAKISAANSGDPLDGDFTLGNDWNADATTPADEYAFSSCIGFETGVGYKASVQAACGEDTQASYPERFRFVYNTTPTVAGNTGIASFDVPLATYSEFSSTFTVPSTGDYYFGIHINSDANAWYINLDNLNITSFTASPTAGMSVSGHDEIVGGVYQSLCTGEFTITNTSTGEVDATTVDWGDGNSEPFTATGTLTHIYATMGVYTITVTSTNILGSDVATEQVELAMLPAPTGEFSYVQATPSSVTITFSADQVVSCYNYDWNFGDNSAHPSTASTSHTYLANGTYTVTLFMQDPVSGDNNSISYDVVITGVEDPTIAINEIDFANGINVFPNPVNDVLNINFELNSVQTVEISLHSIDGKVVNAIYSTTSSVMEVMNTSKLATGIYILDITTDTGKHTTNVVVK